MNDKFEFIENPIISDYILEGYTSILKDKHKVKVTLDIEEEASNFEDFKSLAKVSGSRISLLNNKTFEKLKDEISNEITQSSYSQSDYSPKDEDYNNLKNELQVDQINFYEEDFMLIFLAKNNFPDSKIFCQVNDDFEIENIEVINN